MTRKKVIVVGAGMSGAKAAHDLRAAGHDITVLEARDRIGGRIWTNREFGYPVDIGASWIHGIKKNPVHTLAKSLNTELVTWDYEDLKFYSSDEAAFWRAYGKFSVEFEKNSERIYRRKPNASVQDVIDAMQHSGKFDDLTPGEFAMLAKWEFEQSYATDAKDLALATFFEGGDEFGGDDVLFPNGYDELVKHLLYDIDVQLNQPVTTITYSDSGAHVETNTDAFEADFVIVTVSVGVLKSGAIEFSPPLPGEKATAIGGLEMGLLNKLCLKYDHVFWDDNAQFVAEPDDRATWSTWFNFTEVSGEPTLVCMNSGDLAREIESYSNTETVESALASLRKMFGSSVTKPRDYLVTRWASDPHALGSYSHLPPGATTALNNGLAQPVGARLFFAGEATEDTHYATVHGAFLSGERAAAEIMAEI